MELNEFFPFWDALTPAWQAGLREAALPRKRPHADPLAGAASLFSIFSGRV